MSQKQTYNSCEYLTYKSCSHVDKELMKDLIGRISASKIVRNYGMKLDFSKAEKVNKKLCNTCDSFKRD
jgi:hypothetical protein